MFLFLEYCWVALLVAGVYFLRGCPSKWIEAIEHRLGRLARRRALSVVVVGLICVGLRAALLPILPVPQPGIHDEFSYLLASDTFAHGRITNPTHPMWIHFESFHINHQPTYMSAYEPGQGLILALGQVLTGKPWVGVLLITGAMCAAICWMLQGWLPPGWALLGGLLAVLRLGTFSYWMNSYYGGSLTAFAGALVLGALPRLKRRPTVKMGLLMGLGFAILGVTRPFEGLFFSIPVVVVLLKWAAERLRSAQVLAVLRAVLPMGVLVLGAAAGMAYYCYRVTGSPTRLPHQLSSENYGYVPAFPWQPLMTWRKYHHPVMEHFYKHERWMLDLYYRARTVPFDVLTWKLTGIYHFFLGPVLTLPLAVFVTVLSPVEFLRRAVAGKTRALLAVCATTFVGIALPIFFNAHYAAPMTAAIYALMLQLMRHLRLWCWREKRSGLALVRGIPTVCVLLLGLRLMGTRLDIRPVYQWEHMTWESEHFQNLDRAKALTDLEGMSGEHLVIVRYNVYHDTTNEWIYNRADIDDAKVVWARDMGEAANAELIHYFPKRQVWLAEPDLAPPRLSQYSSAAPELRSLQEHCNGERPC